MKNRVDGETSLTAIKIKETHWSEVPYLYPHRCKTRKELILDLNTHSTCNKNQSRR